MTGGPPPHDNTDPLYPVQALALSLVMPWKACQGAWREARVGQSLLYHAFGMIAFFIGLAILDAALWGGGMVQGLQYIDPIVLMLFAIWLILIQLCYMVTAWWTSCWGAGIEPFRESFGRSLSRWYQLTPFHAAWTLAFIVAMNVIDEMRWNGFNYNYDSVNYQIRELFYNLAMLATFVLYCGVGGWFTLRALAVPRSTAVFMPNSRWPALCETCGYAIVGLTSEQTCPECGRTVHSSLYTPRGNNPHTTLAKMRLALFNPAALGEILQTRTRTASPAKALAITALSLLAIGPIGVAYVVFLTAAFEGDLWIDNMFDFLQIFMVGGLGAGLGAMCVGVTVVLGVGSLISLIDRVFGKRNNLPAACQAACYASGYVLFMALLMFGFTGAFVVFTQRYLDHMGRGLIAFIPLVWLCVFLLLITPYMVLVGRIVRGTRHANA